MSSPVLEPGSIVAGRYRIVAPLGVGASARVYLADDRQLKRHVAIKVLRETLAEDKQFLKRFRAEALAAAALNHPNVMHIYDSGELDVSDSAPLPYLITEFVGGGSLRAVLDSGPLLSPSQALTVGLAAARGLEYAHGKGFVHRDIKPANLLFGPEGRLRIADFGLARALAEATWTEPQGILLGTARYASPEQAKGRDVDGRSDVYSLALSLVESVTGSVPFSRNTVNGTLMARTEDDLEVPRSLGRLAPVLERAGRRDPDLRPDAGELVIAFLAASEDMERPAEISLPGAIKVEVLNEFLAKAAEMDQAIEGVSAVDADPETADADRSDADPEAVDAEVAEVAEVAAPSDRTDEAPLTDITMLGAADATMMVALPTAATQRVGVAARDSSRTSDVESAAQRSPYDIPLDDSGGLTVDSWISEPTSRQDDGVSDHDAGDYEYEDEGSERSWPWILLTSLVVVALIGGASYWWFAIRVPSHRVPDLTGVTAKKATRDLEDLGFKVERVNTRRDKTKREEVVGQKPAHGADLDEGKTVEITVSLGQTLVTLPTFTTQMTVEEATKIVQGARLVVGASSKAHDEKIPAGQLISALPGAGVQKENGEEVEVGSPIDFVVSDGPAPRTIPPGLEGQSRSVVVNALTNLQLKPEVTLEYSDVVDAGIVISINKADNAQVPRDSVVAVAVSQGPEPVAVPNVIGKSATDASKILVAAGFVVSNVYGSPLGKVLAIDPAVGQKLQKGTSVRLFTGA